MRITVFNTYQPPDTSSAPPSLSEPKVTTLEAPESINDTDVVSDRSFDRRLEEFMRLEDDEVRKLATRRQLSRSIRRATGLDRNGSVSEEALFAGLMGLHVLDAKGREHYLDFANTVRQQIESNGSGLSVEQAAKETLMDLREEGVLRRPATTTIYSQAFYSAQLDDDERSLFDNEGGPRDDSIAVSPFQLALDSAVNYVEQVRRGVATVPTRLVEEPETRG